MNDEKLREILKRGDPAAGEPGMTPEEVREMRRTVLSAVPEPRKRGWLVPVMAGAAALVVVVIALTLWKPEPPKQAVRPPERPPLPLAGEGRGEGVKRIEKTPPLPSPAPQEREPPPSPVREPEPEPEPEPQPEPEPVVLAQADGPTQIQFSTPGGTRIIWVLQPATE